MLYKCFVFAEVVGALTTFRDIVSLDIFQKNNSTIYIYNDT